MLKVLEKTSEIEIIKDVIAKNLPYMETDFGKMIRAKIGVLFLKAKNQDTMRFLPFLSAIELIHTSSLLHDDVIDNENFRREKANIKTKHGNKTSVLYGDMVLSNALKLISDYNSTELIKSFNSTLNNMCRGEILQQTSLGIIPTMDEYIEKSRLKTASLFEFILDGINIISENRLILPVEFGTYFGIAFQIKNDLDNVCNTKSDIKNGIYTAPVIYSQNMEDLDSGIEKTLGLIDNYRERCIKQLSEYEDNIYIRKLIEVVECLKN